MSMYKDRVRQTVRCTKCQRVLCKIDTDGTIHVKPPRGPQQIIKAQSKIMFICDKIAFFSNREIVNGSKGVECGNKTTIEDGVVLVYDIAGTVSRAS